jgi:surface antigen
MRVHSTSLVAALYLAASFPVSAESVGMPVRELAPYLQCVPYARALTGIQIYGDAHTWWDQAAGRYDRGKAPRVGAVMAFVPQGSMTLGHVAAVSRVLDSRTVLLDHANWSPINGRRGQVERDVRAVDVSPGNDWSQVRVWYAPVQGIGTTVWPVHGFIYGSRSQLAGTRLAAVSAPQVAPQPLSPTPSRAFANAFAGFEVPVGRPAVTPRAAPQRVAATPQRRAPVAVPAKRDPIEAALARYGS